MMATPSDMGVELDLDLQIATEAPGLPEPAELECWAAAALAGRRARAALSVRLVDPDESRALNLQYRGIDRPTNVLSFPFELPPGIGHEDPVADLLGDLVICAEVVRREALEQGKEARAHWAHMIVHGSLHLIDYDHITDEQADRMESLERTILHGLGFPSPYEDQDDLEER